MQGLAGVTVSLLNILTQLSGDDVLLSALIFFSLSLGIITICLGTRCCMCCYAVMIHVLPCTNDFARWLCDAAAQECGQILLRPIPQGQHGPFGFCEGLFQH